MAPITARDGSGSQSLTPSWAEYMDDLWSEIPRDAPNHLSLEEFSRLPAPAGECGQDGRGRSRRHLLGKALHRDEYVLTNPLLQELARLIVRPALDRGLPHASADLDVDVITTNVDCALEQNIAAALDTLWSDPADIGHRWLRRASR